MCVLYIYIYMIKFEIREIRKLASQCWMSPLPLQSSSSPQAPMMMKLPLTTLKLQQKLRQRRWLRNVPSHDLLPKWQWYGMGTRSSGQDVLRYDDIINFWKNIFKRKNPAFRYWTFAHSWPNRIVYHPKDGTSASHPGVLISMVGIEDVLCEAPKFWRSAWVTGTPGLIKLEDRRLAHGWLS